MLKPDKYLDLRTCTLNVASNILSELLLYKVMSLDEISKSVQAKLGDDSGYNFLPAINFLFLIGSVDYDAEHDNIYLLTSSVTK